MLVLQFFLTRVKHCTSISTITPHSAFCALEMSALAAPAERLRWDPITRYEGELRDDGARLMWRCRRSYDGRRTADIGSVEALRRAEERSV